MESGQPGWTQRRPIVGLTSADLSDAELSDAILNYVMLGEANLRGANLRGADLNNTVLFNTDLADADLRFADLTGAKGMITEELEQQVASLQGATMPNGQKYEEWLKDREDRREDEKDRQARLAPSYVRHFPTTAPELT